MDLVERPVADSITPAEETERSKDEICLLYTSPSPETVLDLVCRLLLEKKNKTKKKNKMSDHK